MHFGKEEHNRMRVMMMMVSSSILLRCIDMKYEGKGPFGPSRVIELSY